MTPLNFPSYEYKVKNKDGKVFIFDIIRKKYVALTPEEWVRQHMINFMIFHLNYPKSLITIETGLKYNQLNKRSDVVVFGREGSPWLLVECKAPGQKIDDHVSFQAAVYNQKIRAPFLVMTNGLIHHCFFINHSTGEITPQKEFPQYP